MWTWQAILGIKPLNYNGISWPVKLHNDVERSAMKYEQMKIKLNSNQS